MILDWHDEAREEFLEAVRYYEDQVEGLGERFLIQVEAAAARVASSPFSSRVSKNGSRRTRLERFPYAVIYRVREDDVQILAVAHAKRRPGYWTERL